MKLENLEINEVQTLGDSEDIEFGIDREDEWIIFKSFTNYSDPIGSLVRELVSNAFDAHIEAEVDEPVIVKINEEDVFNGIPSSLSIIDKGMGLSPHIIKTVYSKFGKSTKRNRDDSIGAFGFGAKSPLGYGDMFELITISEGVKYYYSVHKGEKRPIITLLSEEDTDEDNGTEVRVLIKEGDEHTFREAVRENLTYFDNINYINCDIDNDYKIIKGNHFIYSTNVPDYANLHLCLGKVRYPLNHELIGENYGFQVPIGLYFDIGEIPVVWNRENIEYTDKAIAKIKEKLKFAGEELQGIYNKLYENIDTLEGFIEADVKNTIQVYKVEEESINIPVKDSRFIKLRNTYQKYKHLKVTKGSALWIPFKCLKSQGGDLYYSTVDPFSNAATYLLKRGQSHSSIYFEYLKDKNKYFYIWAYNNKRETVRSYLRHYFNSSFTKEPYKFSKLERQEAIEEAYKLYDEVVDYIKKNSNPYDPSEVPEQWLEDYREEQARIRQERQEMFHYMEASTHGSYQRYRINGDTLKDRFKNELVIYGFQKDRPALKETQDIIERELGWRVVSYIHVIQISMRNEKVIKEILGDKACHVNNVKNIPFIKRMGEKYNLDAWIDELDCLGAFEDVKNRPSSKYIPTYITPSDPTEEQKTKIYKYIGNQLKYPLLPYISSSAPSNLVIKYKETCPYHNINPILIGKKHLKSYESKRNQEQ